MTKDPKTENLLNSPVDLPLTNDALMGTLMFISDPSNGYILPGGLLSKNFLRSPTKLDALVAAIFTIRNKIEEGGLQAFPKVDRKTLDQLIQVAQAGFDIMLERLSRFERIPRKDFWRMMKFMEDYAKLSDLEVKIHRSPSASDLEDYIGDKKPDAAAYEDAAKAMDLIAQNCQMEKDLLDKAAQIIRETALAQGYELGKIIRE